MYGRGKKTKQTKSTKHQKFFYIRKELKKIKDRIIRDIWTLFGTEEEKTERNQRKKELNKRLIKDRIIKDIRALFEQEEYEDYYRAKRVNNFWNNSCIEYESNGDKFITRLINRNLLLDEYPNKIECYLRNAVLNLQNSDTWKTELTIAINFIFSKNTEVERAMHSRSNNIELASYNDASEVVDELLLMMSHFVQDIK